AIRQEVRGVRPVDAMLILAVLSERVPPDQADAAAGEVVRRLHDMLAWLGAKQAGADLRRVPFALGRRLPVEAARAMAHDLLERLEKGYLPPATRTDLARALLALLP